MFTGCGTALVTPFRHDLSLDEAALHRLVRRQIEAGINFLVPCGTTGESPTLRPEEQRRVVEITLEEARRDRSGNPRDRLRLGGGYHHHPARGAQPRGFCPRRFARGPVAGRQERFL